MIIITIRRHHIFSAILIILISGYFFLSTHAFAALSCSITTSCPSPGTVVFRMASTTNSHSELPSQSLYPNLVCCTGISGIGNQCSGTFAVVAHISSTTNAHMEQANLNNYPENICLQAPPGGSVSVGYQDNNCSGFDTTLVSLASSSNSHVGGPNDYTRKICVSMSEPTLSFAVDSSNQSFTISPGTVATTTSILSVSTSNPTGFSVSVQKESTSTLILQSDSSIAIPDKTEWVAPGATTTAGDSTASTTDPFSLQFRIEKNGTDDANYASTWWGTTDSDTNALFAGFSSTTQSIVDRSVATTGTSTATVLYNLNVDTDQETGVYSGTLLYTVTANP